MALKCRALLMQARPVMHSNLFGDFLNLTSLGVDPLGQTASLLYFYSHESKSERLFPVPGCCHAIYRGLTLSNFAK